MKAWSLPGFGESKSFQRSLYIFWKSRLTLQLKQIEKNLECEYHISDEDVDDSNCHDYVDEEVISEVSDYE